MSNVLRYRNWKTPKQPGERARLKVVHGADQGVVFVLLSERFTVGRGDENDVVITDLKASRRHAEFRLMPTGTWKLTDLGSQNGLVWNGKVTRETDLRSGDVVTVGETALEFVPETANQTLLLSAPRMIRPEHLQGQRPVAHPAVLSSQLPHTPLLSGAGDVALTPGIPGLVSSSGGWNGDSKKLLIRGALVAVLAILLFVDSPEETAKIDPEKLAAKKEEQKKKRELERELASFLPPLPSKGGPTASAETFFQEGFREFREGNYLRARVQFETALQINPGHGVARSYLQQSERAIIEQVENHIDRGRKDFESGKLRSAKANFESVLRLLYREPDHPSYQEAKGQLSMVISRIRAGGDS